MSRSAAGGACYMSDSEAKQHSFSQYSNSKKLKVSSKEGLPPKFAKKRDSMPDLLRKSGDEDENTRSFLYAEPIPSNQMNTRADLASLSQHNQLTHHSSQRSLSVWNVRSSSAQNNHPPMLSNRSNQVLTSHR